MEDRERGYHRRPGPADRRGSDGFADCPLFIDDDPDTSLSNFCVKAIRHQLEYGLDLLIVDYLQLIEVPKGIAARENRVQEISIISRGLKQLARELPVPVITLSQLNLAVEMGAAVHSAALTSP